MRKAMILMALTSLLVALMAGGAMAKGKGSGKAPKPQREITYVFAGTITGVDLDARTFTVAVEEGNKAARTYLGEQNLGEQTFTFEDGYTKVEVDEVEDMGLADLVEGQQVSVQTKASTPERVVVARRVSAVTAAVGEEVPST